MSSRSYDATIVPTEVDKNALIKMRAELDNVNHCALPFLSRAAANSC